MPRQSCMGKPLFFVCRALWRPTATASRKKAVERQRNLGLHHDMQNMAKMMMMMMTFVKIGVMKLKTGLTYMNIQENKILHLKCVNFFWSIKKWFDPVKVVSRYIFFYQKQVASCDGFSYYYLFSDIAINSVNPSFIWRLEFLKNG